MKHLWMFAALAMVLAGCAKSDSSSGAEVEITGPDGTATSTPGLPSRPQNMSRAELQAQKKKVRDAYEPQIQAAKTPEARASLEKSRDEFIAIYEGYEKTATR